ncbi:MAG: triose-phosphate isomerase [Rhodobacter sp.]|nr:triose-phosphate isomerase [Rhodobacter sp.]
MATPVWIGSGWKMTKRRDEALDFARRLAAGPADPRIQRMVFPPFTLLREIKAALAGTGVLVGAQTMHWEDDGAWTGEISAPMLVDCGTDLVELGHSERRRHFGETDDTIALKVAAALRHGLQPVVCVGETAAQQQEADAVLARQVAAAVSMAGQDAPVMFAYEPVWAIGEGGEPATPGYADARHERIKVVAADRLGVPPLVFYGGSVNAGNCAELIVQRNVDGLFIGRAAWTVEGYWDILRRVSAVL